MKAAKLPVLQTLPIESDDNEKYVNEIIQLNLMNNKDNNTYSCS